MTFVKFADVVSLSTTRTSDPASSGIDRFVGLEHIEPENLHIRSWGLAADSYHAFKDVEGFAKVALLEDIQANEGNLNIPFYVRSKAIGEEKSIYAVDRLIGVLKTWEESSIKLNSSIEKWLNNLE